MSLLEALQRAYTDRSPQAIGEAVAQLLLFGGLVHRGIKNLNGK